jgi:uncharacterized protein YjbJ (UPF0337 family)
MSFIDKAKHRAEEVIGDVKEKVGELTGNDELQAEGRMDQVSGNVKQVGDSVRDPASDIADKLEA